VDPLQPSPEAHHKVDSEGETFIWQARPGVAVERGVGLLTLPLARCFTEFLDPLLVPGSRWDVFADFEWLTHYTHEAREYLSAFTVERIACVGELHFLISSKVIALGLSSYRDAIGAEHVRVYSERSSFLRSFADAMQVRS
jgi:hypothetical protein